MNILNCSGCGKLVYKSTPGSNVGCCPEFGGREWFARNLYVELKYHQQKQIASMVQFAFEHIAVTMDIPDIEVFGDSHVRTI